MIKQLIFDSGMFKPEIGKDALGLKNFILVGFLEKSPRSRNSQPAARRSTARTTNAIFTNRKHFYDNEGS